MYGLIFLCSLFLVAHAADDGSDLSYNQMMQRLRKAETANQFSGESKFVYGESYENYAGFLPGGCRHHEYLLLYIRKAIQGVSRKEINYFKKVAASTLSDEEKISEQLVCTHFFDKVLRTKDQQEKDEFLKLLSRGLPDRDYPAVRLLLAASVYVGANVKVLEGKFSSPLRRVLSEDDLSLARLLLKKGANSNQETQEKDYSILAYCRSTEAVKLMVEHGADITQTSYHERDLVRSIWDYNRRIKEKNNLLIFYLQYTPLSESNEFGCSWMRQIAREYVLEEETDEYIETVKILLEHGCTYTDKIKTQMYKKMGSISSEAQAKIERVFTEHEWRVSGKNIKGAKNDKQ